MWVKKKWPPWYDMVVRCSSFVSVLSSALLTALRANARDVQTFFTKINSILDKRLILNIIFLRPFDGLLSGNFF
jgi:hypothetical protein